MAPPNQDSGGPKYQLAPPNVSDLNPKKLDYVVIVIDRNRKIAGTENETGSRFLTGAGAETGTETGMHCTVDCKKTKI